MRKAALIYNLVAGQKRHLRLARVEAAAEELRTAGIEATLVPTRTSGSAEEQVREAIAAGHDAIFACGGDGTVHDVLQGMMALDDRQIALGIVPLGTGNVLAYDLGIPNDAREAIRAQLGFEPRRIAVGKCEFQSQAGTETRYFAITTGVGWDAELIYRVSTHAKSRWGMLAYVWQGLLLHFTYPFPRFRVEFEDLATGQRRAEDVLQLSVLRVLQFGPYMRKVAPGASLDRDDFQLLLFKTDSILRQAWYMLGAWWGKNWEVKGIQLAHARDVTCSPLPGEISSRPPRAEADGEFLGSLPARITCVPDALTLLMRPR